jgi:hypothetical protein
MMYSSILNPVKLVKEIISYNRVTKISKLLLSATSFLRTTAEKLSGNERAALFLSV